MKKGQVGLGLVIFAIVAITAVIGLVLLFTRASAEGAAIGNTYGGGQKTINQPYGAKAGASYSSTDDLGIAYTYPHVKYTPPAYGGPETQYPYSYPQSVTKGMRTPGFVIKGYTSIEDLYGCSQDLTAGPKIGVPHDQFNCYTVPNKGGSNAEGFFEPASAAHYRPAEGRIGKTGGDVYCYANSGGAGEWHDKSEDLIRESIITTLIENDAGLSKYKWSTTTINGKEVPICWVSEKVFPFGQY